MGRVTPVLLLAAIVLPGVLAQVPTVTIAQTSFGAQVSTTITLGCTVSSVTTVTNVFWQRDVGNGVQTITVDGVNFSGSTVSSPSLTLINGDVTDTGTYTCFAVNAAGTGNSATASVTISSSVPTITVGQTAYTTSTGNSITLQCTVSSTTQVTNVFWRRIINGVSTTLTIDNINYSGATVSSPSLTVINADSNDSGFYTCFATNTAGTGQSSQTQLTVGAVPAVTISQNAYSTNTGNSITLGCTVSANPAHTSVFWQRNVGTGTQTITIDNINYSGSTVNSPSLTVLNADTSDSGTYTCFATNSVGTGQSSATTLTVSGNVPSVTVSQTIYSVSTGATVTLQCSVSANPGQTNVFWQFTATSGGTTTLTIDNVNYGGSSVNSPSLVVFNANSGDQGTYTCFASNSVGTGQSAQVSLSVTGNVPTVTISQNAYSTNTGNTITLGCTVSANPAHTSVFWQRNVGTGTQTITIDNINFSGATVNSPSLTVLNADTSDTGTYTCFATNSAGTGQSSATTLTVSGNVPTVTISQNAYSTNTGNTITLGCTVSANPAHTSVFWQRNVGSGTQTITIDNINFSGATVNSPSLTVLNADTSDTGTYTCFATNSAGTGQSSATTLTVSGNVPTVTISQNAYSTNTGNSITLGCTVSANPAHTSVFWQRNVGTGTQTITIDGVNYSGSTVNSPSLTVLNTDTSDTGTYTCFATNSVGTGQSAATTLTVSGNIPTVTISQNSYSTTTGNSITLGCTVSANPAHTSVFWQRNVGGSTQSITIDGINYSGSTVNSPSLTIINADSSDSGTYTCFATNSVGTGQSFGITLTVTGNVPTVTISQNIYRINTGNTVTLGCTVSGSPAHTSVFWQRNVGTGTQSITIDGVNYSGSTVNSPSLTVINADTSDSGTYTCFATNSVGTGQSAATTLTVSGNIPTVTISQNAYSTNTGNSITLGCTVSANPAHTSVFWQRNVGTGTQTITIDGVNYSGSTVNSPSLTVLNADTSDTGTYTCFATNSVGTGQSSATTLTVTGNIPTVTISQNAYSTNTGNSITLGCTVSANPTHTSVFWQRNVGTGTQTITIDGINYSGSTVNSPSLTVLNADTSDTGTYTCFATNSVGTGQSSATTLTVTGNIPTVTISQNAYSTNTGNSITLGCTVSANPTHTSVFWQRNVGSGTETLTIDGVNYSGSTVNSPSLTVLNADTSDTGTYTCFATNSVGTGQSSATTLTVTGNIPTVTISQNAYSTNTGNSITLGCTVSANPAHTSVFWQRNVGSGTETLTIDGVNYSGSTVNSPSLTVLNAATSDTGTYTCFATNSVGTGQSSATTLTVTGNIPTVTISQNAYSTNTGNSITLGCTVSANPAHTSVFWQRNVGSGTQSITIDGVNYSGSTVNSPSLTVINADTSDTGTYTCFATNSVGTGQSSATTLTVTGNIPTVTISQNAYSTNTGTTITLGCTVSANPAHTTVFWQRNVGSGTQSITVDGINYSGSTVNSPSLTVLNADTSDTGTYTCFATNSVGTGQSSATTLTVTGNIPTVTISQNAYSTNTGNSITLGCTVSANPTHTSVFWQRNVGSGTQSITIDGVNYSGATVNSPSLTVLNADTSDTGTYTCFATNSVGTGQSSATTLTVTGNIPTVTISQNAYSINTGNSITLGCTVSANPAHTSVFWQRNVGSGTETLTIDGVNYSGSTVNSPSLTVLNADTSDTGTYTCFATNSVGTGQSSATTLTVTGNIPTVTISQNAYSTNTGNSITLGCTVSANPAHTSVSWQRNVGSGTETLTIDDVNYSGSTVNSPSLTVLNADTSDTGTYTCFATNSVGTGQSSATTLTVTGNIPTVTISQNAYNTNSGNTITLECTVSANPAHTSVFWQRNVGSGTESITIDSVNYSGSTVNSPSLTVINADTSDTGTYTCFATNSVGTGQSTSTTLTVTGNVPTVTIAQSAYITNTGSTISLECTVSANPAHSTVFWQRNIGTGTESINIDDVKYSGSTVNSPSLTVINADTSDTGTYTCFATNSVGTGQSSATTLTVTGNIPTVTVSQNTYGTNTGNTITLGCTVSASPAHTIVFWQRNVGSGTESITIDGDKYSGATVNAPSLTVINADTSDTGTYTCFATNSVGTGQSSATTLTVTGNIPTVAISENAYATDTGNTISLECTVSANPAHTTVFWQRNVGSGTESITIDDVNYSGSTVNSPSLTVLNADTSDTGNYTCFATNSVGTGQSSATILTVTGNIPTVTIAQNAYSTNTGTSITLQCTVSANPAHTTVFWQRNVGTGTQSITIDNINYSGSTVNSPSLTVLNADTSDTGTYTCFASNSVGTGQSSATTLTVTGNIPVVTVAQNAYSTNTGTSITLQCTVSANPAHTTVFWQRNVGTGTQSITIDGVNYSGSTVNSPSLTVLNADTSDTGTYTCFATNSVGTGQSSATTLTVTGNIPVVTIAQNAYNTNTGTTITLGCTVSANPAHTTVFWQRNVGTGTQSITIDGVNYSGSTVNSPSLTVLNADTSDTGTYTCFATNSVGTGQSSATTLTVTGNIPVVTIAQNAYSTNTGTSITLQCTVSANPTHTSVSWTRNVGSGTQSITVDGVNYSGSTVNSPSLTVLNADTSDTGTYTCFATNSVGTGQSSATTLTVTGNIPTVTVPQTFYPITTGTTVTLQCFVSANPTHTSVFWQFTATNGGTTTLTIDNVNYGGSSVNSPSLVVFNANSGDQGTYVCFASNQVGTGQSAQVSLAVTGNIPVVTIAQNAYSTNTGTSITLQCTVSANPTHTSVSWTRNVGSGTQSITIDGVNYSGSTVNSPSLTVINADTSDTGTYTCFATNSVGTGQSSATTLTVTGNIPTVTVPQTFYPITTGTTVTLQCFVSANPTHTSVFWQFTATNGGTTTLTIDNVNYGGSSVNSPSLVVFNANSGDQGTYVCFASNQIGTGQSAQVSLAVTGNIPVVTIAQNAYSTNTGTSITLQCTVSANPTHTSVSWTRNVGSGTQSITVDGVNYSGSTVNSPSLTVINADTSDTGTYTCFATNSVGTGQSSATTLTVSGNIPVVTIDQSSYTVSTGQSVTLGCSVSAVPTHTSVTWTRVTNGVSTPITIDGVKYAGSTVNAPSLIIFNAAASDQTFYSCSATNAIGTGTSTQTSLTVVGSLPVVTVAQNSYTITTGGTITLVCTVSATPSASSVSWRRLVGGASTPISVTGNKYSGVTLSNPSLTISGAQSSDEGFYICQATNIVGTGESSTTYLTVSGSIPVVTIPQNSYSILTGGSVVIDCTVSSVPAHTSVSWNRVSSSGGISAIQIDGVNYSGGTVNSPSLSVNNADSSDTGFYVCTATNSIGTGTSNQAYLSVTGAPPTATVAQTSYTIVTGASVTLQCTVFGTPAVTGVSWTRTYNNGGSTVLSVNGQKYAGGSINNPSLTIFNADNTDQATYVCSATNSLGTGQSQAVSLSVTGNPPTVTVSQTQYSVITGASITLQCSVTAIPAATNVFWERTSNGFTNQLTIDQVQYGGSTISSPSLVIFNANSNDDGIYVCKASNTVGTGSSQGVTISVTGSVPVVNIQQASYTVNTGSTATLVCTVTATPNANSVTWRRTINGVSTAITINGGKYTGGSVNSPSLVIYSTTSSDIGFYTCEASNAVGTGTSADTYLDVVGSLLNVQVAQPFYSVQRGQSVTLVCTVSGTPSVNAVAWRRTSNSVTNTVTIDNNKYQGSSINSPSLIINNADSVDTGTYVCTATNIIGTAQSTQTTLSVTGDIPTVTIPTPSYDIVTGSSITITCSVSADPQHTSVSWTRANNINSAAVNIVIDGSTYSGGTVNNPSLTINSASASDQGYYVCSAANSIGVGTSGQTYLTVTGALPSVTIPSNAYSVITGGSIQIPCTVVASPSATSVTWTKSSGTNTAISIVTIDNSKYQGATPSLPSLTITNAGANDQAYYRCSATNSVGSAESILTYLSVSGNVPVVTIGQSQYNTLLGTSITIDCTVSATPQATTVAWERIINGVSTTLTIDGTKFVGSSVNNPSLTINDASTNDMGYYICTAINSVGVGRSSQGYLTVDGFVPAVVISKPSYSFVVGETAVIDCDYSSSPDATSVYWNKIVDTQTTRIETFNTNKYSGSTLANPSLTITNTDSSDQAFYRCVVVNSVGEGRSNQAYLYITGNIPSVTVPQSSYSVSLDETVTITCTVSAIPSATTITWEYIDTNGVVGNINVANSRYSGGIVSSPSLVISAATLSDQGTYRCKASNSVGTGQSQQVFLYVTGTIPSVRVTVSAYTVDVDTSATLACIVDASPAATDVYWTKIVSGVSSRISTSNTNKYTGSTVNSPSLIINNLAMSDEGSYRCNAVNTVGTGQSGLTSLIVAYAPRNTVVDPTSLTTREGQSITSECITDANPAATFQWVKDNTNQVVSIGKMLVIDNIDRGHDSTYTCTATNTQGSQTARFNLDVQYRPISTVTVEQSSVVLSLNAQKDLECNTVANPAVQNYRWQKDGNNIADATSLVYRVVATDSNSYGVYTCYATNTIGESSAITYTVSSGEVVTTVRPTVDGISTGLIVAIVISSLVLILIVIIIVCCCVTRGVCREENIERQRVIVEKPRQMQFINPAPMILPRQEMITMDDGFYRTPSAQYQYTPQLAYYETENSSLRSKREI
ncbi:serine-rich adhesin for platelets-like isoform X3 [Argopecten irradians]|uniref:serine-rich adhesin for platelets-like isoform X3 n=1 Tax=Argopecten irradians TaxID=31199 RepID=UPI003719D9AA